MTEGRLCQVHLLDDRKLELLVQPKLLSYELLDLVSSHFNLKEKEFFGLAFFDDNGQCKWLQMDRRVLEHDFSKKAGTISLNFLVRFYLENITQLKDIITVELFYLNAKSAVYNGIIEVETENVFKLAANALQEAKGDYTSDENTRADLKKLPTLPTKVLKEHPSLAYCEDRVIEYHKQLKGVSRGQAIVQYLTLVESLPTYGVHYYEVKDKQGIPWWLGISYKGIGQYDLQDKLKPRKLYQWKQLENLYFREKKFAVEVNDPHRRAVTKRTFGQTGLLIHTWYASHSLIKTIWVMAISQHQFYLDRKQSKAKLGAARTVEEIAMDLTEHGGAKMNRLGDVGLKNNFITASNGSLVSTGSADSEMSEEQKREKLAELRKKEQEIQDILAKKTKELKKICLREAELTGKLPKEYPLSSGERPPQVRRRVGTAFKLDELFPYHEDPFLRNLESRFALQQKIVEAAKKLANESELCKTVKKKRRRNCLDAMHKLQQIEDEMNQYRIKKGKKPTQRASVIIADELVRSDFSSLSSLPLDDDDSDSAGQRPRSRSVQGSPQLSPMRSLGTEYDVERSPGGNHHKNHSRLAFDGKEASHYYQNPSEVSSTHSSPYKTLPRPSRDPRSMPPTPVMTRNAYSSSQLRSEGSSHCFRHRSGSLESQPRLRKDTDVEKPVFILSPAHRSTSTEVLEDCSSYTSQSSLDCCGAANSNYSTLDSRTSTMHRLHRKVEVYGNTGSMPNLVQHHSGCSYSCETATHYAPSAYYVAGYPCPDMEHYANGAYVYENEVEGHYNVNPSYQMNGCHGHDRFRHYSSDGADSLSQNPYATMRPPRNREGPRHELLAKNMHKALVAEHLKGWYHRSRGHRDGGRGLTAGYDFDSSSQLSLGYQTMPAAFSHSSRTTSFSSVSSADSTGNWRNQLAVGLTEFDTRDAPQCPPPGAPPSPYNRSPTHNRFSPENKESDTMPKKFESVDVVGAESTSTDEPSDSHSGT
ncbi:FERM domain-containing protein 4B isoform X1 [Cololabis saira]|uniref:FERM domain-containing protein 4B isoform X1 n=1 Tax=Cololabis saira TaxID=129043 RepID=UPI002AD48C20|nr:FERM domain-containing protein 4B isoform X1 [Cololabis saira]XP_061591459.1 FERM domain-containing protein 4B isoform X1 [Cololabis saira]